MSRSSVKRQYVWGKALCFFSLVILVSGASAAQKKCEETLRVSTSGNWPPYSERIGSHYVGLEIEIVELILRDAGFCWQYVELPSSSRAFKQFQENQVDLIPAASFTQPRRKYAEFSIPYRQEVMLLFTHKHNQQSMLSFTKVTSSDLLESFGNNLIAVSRGSVYGQPFADFRHACEDCVVETNFAHERFNLMNKKRVEYAIEDALTGVYLLQRPEYKDTIKPTAIRIYENPIHYMLRPGMLTEKQLQKLNLAIIKNSQRIEEIIEAYHNSAN
ncbi:substrate-binding periplasmic protein [Pseudoalteromonas luteoviolacea]|uniref:substrate-binding periplasmic protein n=1 Tax=Pseudoalteromonas luteoviolacea TaxID=43657 RepID=UPI000AA090D7|nr:transporter substrate-binding domain-containing protein [Pseudoalteromonas luteoviolacea]